RSQMIMNMPLEVILAELECVFGSRTNNVINRVQTEILRLAKLPPQPLIFKAAAQCPDCIHERQLRKLQPGCSQVPDLVRMTGNRKIECVVANQKHVIELGSRIIGRKRLEFRL